MNWIQKQFILKNDSLNDNIILKKAILFFLNDHASRRPTELARQIPIACTQCWDTPDNGQWIYPKHVEYFMK